MNADESVMFPEIAVILRNINTDTYHVALLSAGIHPPQLAPAKETETIRLFLAEIGIEGHKSLEEAKEELDLVVQEYQLDDSQVVREGTVCWRGERPFVLYATSWIGPSSPSLLEALCSAIMLPVEKLQLLAQEVGHYGYGPRRAFEFAEMIMFLGWTRCQPERDQRIVGLLHSKSQGS